MNLRHTISRILRLMLLSLSVTVIGYTVFALLFSTDTEKRLKRENALYRELYSQLKPEEELIGDVVTGLQVKDAEIYNNVFSSEAPNVDPVGNLDFLFGSDTIPDRKIVSYTSQKAMELESRAAMVEKAFMKAFDAACREGVSLPPMSSPLAGLSYSQVGAGAGMKINPFYKTFVRHQGLDFIAPLGTPVRASADGVVSVSRISSKGLGRHVKIQHIGGYITVYAHLSELNVTGGQRVKRGQMIGKVGMSGNAFAPHLHYEVWQDSLSLNPINYIFVSVSPDEYSNMLFMSANTQQSMD